MLLFLYICTVSDLRALLKELHPVRASWYNIGLELDIPYTTLDCYEKKNSDHLYLLREVLKHWLDSAVPTWEAVVVALRSPIVDNMRLAAKLESKYCTPVQCMREEGNCSIHVDNSEGIAIS